MRLLKRGLCLVLTVVLSLVCIGCANNNGGEKDDITLTWFLPLSEQPDGQLVMQELSSISKEKIGANVELHFTDLASYQERMTMNMASGNSFDLCFTGYVNPYIQGVDNGGFLELDDLLKNEAPKLYEALPEYAWDIARVNGKIYAVPNLQGFAPPTSIFLFNDLIEKHEFDISSINTVEDIEPYLATIKEKESHLYPWRNSYGITVWLDGKYEAITSGLFIRCDGSSPEILHYSEIPEYERGLNVLHDWYKKGYIRSDLLSAGSDIQDFNAGKYAVSQSGWLPGAEATAKQTHGRDVTIVPIMEPYMAKSKSLAAMTAIGLNSKHPEKAIKLIELINTDKEAFNLLTLGIKDRHYTLNEEGKYELIEGSGYRTSGGWLFGNQFNQILAANQEDGIWEETAQMNLNAKKSPILGFVLDTNKIKNEISQIAAVESEFSNNTYIVNGTKDLSKKYAKLKEAGLDTVKREVQKQINEYWKNK